MKTQIFDLVQGSQFVAGTNQEKRNAIGEAVKAENPGAIALHLEGVAGAFDITLNYHESTTGKSWYYSADLTDEQAGALGYNMGVYVYEHRASLLLYSDMRMMINFATRKTPGSVWKFRHYSKIDNKIITIL